MERIPDVSRETLERLQAYEALIRKWNPRINLVSRNSLDEFWARHIEDSLQIFHLVEAKGHWVDMGSGGGLPGIVIAVCAMEAPDLRVTMIESDQRKSAFLRAALRETGAEATVINKRIEQTEPQSADVLSARALADLSQLLVYSDLHMKPGGTALFPKGAQWKKEVDAAKQRWKFDLEAIKSKTESEAAIIKITGVSNV